MKVVISSGHGKYIRGAKGYLDEVDEARKVVESVAAVLRSQGVGVTTYHDDTSTTQNENLNRIVSFHNAQPSHDLDVSVHFNAYQTTSKPMGHECLYKTQQTLSATESNNVVAASGLINRGAKKRTDLYFLNNTRAPAILTEVCFVDSQADANIYKSKYDAICAAIATSISGREVQPVPPEPAEPGPPPDVTRPTLSKGSLGPDVVYLQNQLNSDNNAGLQTDGNFGSRTESAVYDYQASRNLTADGIVGPNTWDALETDKPPYQAPGLPPKLSDVDIGNITQIAMNSPIATYAWKNRGVAPPAYIQGFALSFANVYRKFLRQYQPAVMMAQARTSNSKDVFNVYKAKYDSMGMNNDQAGANALRHLYALQLGLGMRESSGKHCEGRDMSATNTTSDTCEAGLYQTSYNAHNASSQFDKVMDDYRAGAGADDPQGFLSVFSQGVSCSSSSWSCYGSGNGYKFQEMCKKQPAFAVETCAITLRVLSNHYGPINRGEAELRADANTMLKAVQDYIDGNAPLVA